MTNGPAANEGSRRQPLLIKIDEVARLVGLSVRTVRRLVRQGCFPKPIAVGRSRRWRTTDVKTWVRNGIPSFSSNRPEDNA